MNVLRADGAWLADTTQLLRDEVAPCVAGAIVPLARFLALAPSQRTDVAPWLGVDSDPALLASLAARLPLIAVDFPTFKDGRGFSTATLLRTRYGFRADLRAIGDVLIDQLSYLRRVGFSSFALRADQDPQLAAAALHTFSDVYQSAVDQPLPYFRRRAAAGARP